MYREVFFIFILAVTFPFRDFSDFTVLSYFFCQPQTISGTNGHAVGRVMRRDASRLPKRVEIFSI